MIFRVRWWIASYKDKRRVIDRVNPALPNALIKQASNHLFPAHSQRDQARENNILLKGLS